MSERIHDGEPDTTEPVVRALLAAECPQWCTAPIEYLRSSGTDNAMWRLRLHDQPDVTAAERPAFREALDADDAAWLRGRTFELEHVVGGVLYYVPRRHPLGDVMARTLERILANPQ